MALLPPKASPLFCTIRRSASTAWLGTQSIRHSGSVVWWLMVGGMKPWVIASPQAMAPSALAAPMVWPSIDFREMVRGGPSPKTLLMASASVMSLALVPVPWAEIRSTSSGLTPAFSRAIRMTSATLSPLGATWWYASQLRP